METMALGLDWVGEFMDSFPQLVRPRHLRRFRRFLQETFHKASFQEAYQAWRQARRLSSSCAGRF